MVLSGLAGFVQKESFDMEKFLPLKNSKNEITDSYVSFTVTDNARGSYCRMAIYKSAEGSTDSKTNFDNDWQQFIWPLGASNAQMQTVTNKNGRELQCGTAQYNGNGLSGAVMLILIPN